LIQRTDIHDETDKDKMNIFVWVLLIMKNNFTSVERQNLTAVLIEFHFQINQCVIAITESCIKI
jgi:hypothetical protein